jgi:hypothetical protein
MQIAAISLARTAHYVQYEELDPKNRVGRRGLAAALTERYGFAEFPRQTNDFDIDKDGVVFKEGQLDGINIERLTFFRMGIVAETRSDTDDSERVLDDVRAFLVERTNSAARVAARSFTSQIVFHMDRSIADLNPQLTELAAWVQSTVAQHAGPNRPSHQYEAVRLDLSVDLEIVRFSPGQVTIQRRSGATFAENKYWSDAPLRTRDHISFLERFEQILASPMA